MCLFGRGDLKRKGGLRALETFEFEMMAARPSPARAI
jgi:hypothetical protein